MASAILSKIISTLRPSHKWTLVVFIICLVPRVLLQIVNKECNDDHVTTILLWEKTGEYPGARDCWECFQPPLFYSVVKVTNKLYGATTWAEYFTLIQILNFFFLTAILWMILKYIEALNLSKWLSISSMLFWGLNPELISIGALNTNDTLLILFGMITSIFFFRFLKNSQNLKNELWIFALLFLMGITKGNGLIFYGAFGLIIFLKVVQRRKFEWTAHLRQAFLFVIVAVGIAYAGKYIDKYETYGNAFITNVDPPYEKAKWNEEGTMELRKGVNTYREAFLTFPLKSLLETPYNLTNAENTQLHRQNLWTQFLGQYSNFVFERHPPRWVSLNNDQYNFARVNYVLHAIFVLLILIPLFDVLRKPFQMLNHSQFVHFLLLAVFVAFTIKYSAQYRDFSFMKVVFIYPVYLSIISLFSFAFQKIKFQKLLTSVLFLCSTLYMVNFVYTLIALT